jgi:predicted PurR-regulated permease PerM
MTSPEPATSEGVFMKRTVEAAIRIGVIAGLIAWCFMIARPFLVPIIWGAIIAVAVFHGYDRLQTVLGGQRITAAVLITLLMLVLLVVPSVLLGDSLVSGAHKVMDFVQKGELDVPPPPESVAGWPLIGEPIALLAGLGFLVAGVPAAGLLTLVCLLFGVVQLGVVIVLIPVVIYLFSTADAVTAVGFLIWAILVAPVDNILKPILLGRGVDVPMLIIFVGAIGGFLHEGIIGLFIGAVVLALGYKLFLAWLAQDPAAAPALKPGERAPSD